MMESPTPSASDSQAQSPDPLFSDPGGGPPRSTPRVGLDARLREGLRAHVDATVEALKSFDPGAVLRLVEKLHDAYRRGARVFIFGNGGSAASASHFAEDLAKGTLRDLRNPRRVRAQSLADPMPFLTALGNDCGYETVFREQLITHASPGDVAIAISGSGNSPNVLSAVEWARENGVFTCGLTGFDGGRLRGLVDLSLHAPVADMEVAENCHLVAIHLVVGALRERIAAEG
jgi:D-sedoheptulose 7-phosphate isomerase